MTEKCFGQKDGFRYHQQQYFYDGNYYGDNQQNQSSRQSRPELQWWRDDSDGDSDGVYSDFEFYIDFDYLTFTKHFTLYNVK